jgi:hypothetical protein
VNATKRVISRFGVKILPIFLGFMPIVGTVLLDAGPSDSRRPFKLEVYGGWNFLNPADLNLIVEADKTIQDLLFDQYYHYHYRFLQPEFEKNGDLLPLRNAIPSGLRATWQFHPRWALTVGLEYLSRTKVSTATFNYSAFNGGAPYIVDKKEFADYRIGASAWTALIGLRYEAPVSRTMTFGGFLAGGMSWMKCRHSKEWRWQCLSSSLDAPVMTDPVLTFDQQGSFEEQGLGSGIAAEAGLRIGWRFLPRWTAFCEAGFAYRRSGEVNGSGKEAVGAEEESWNGTWKIVRETMNSWWVTGQKVDIEYPSNRPETNFYYDSTRDFRLNLSGFQVRLGISFALF